MTGVVMRRHLLAHAVAFGLLLGTAFTLSLPAAAQSPGAQSAPTGAYREQSYLIPWNAEGGQPMLAAVIYRPEGERPRPLALVNHGSPRNAAERPSMRPTYRDAAHWLVGQGYVVVVPARRGYGASGGGWAEDYGGCSNPDYYKAGLAGAQDVATVVAYMRRQPFVDGRRVVLFGQSAGGWASIASAGRSIEGVQAIVNFAGGRGSTKPDEVCKEDRLVDAARRFGAGARVPTLWIYSENDRFFGPRLARSMFDAFVAGGAQKAEFYRAPASGEDGHGFFTRASGQWHDVVGAFLRKHGAR
jgi:dienelactone hydrolase